MFSVALYMIAVLLPLVLDLTIFNAPQAEGKKMTLEQVIEYAPGDWQPLID